VIDQIFGVHHLHSMPPLILIDLSRLARSIQSAMEMLPLKRGQRVAHSFNYTVPAFVMYASW